MLLVVLSQQIRDKVHSNTIIKTHSDLVVVDHVLRLSDSHRVAHFIHNVQATADQHHILRLAFVQNTLQVLRNRIRDSVLPYLSSSPAVLTLAPFAAHRFIRSPQSVAQPLRLHRSRMAAVYQPHLFRGNMPQNVAQTILHVFIRAEPADHLHRTLHQPPTRSVRFPYTFAIVAHIASNPGWL